MSTPEGYDAAIKHYYSENKIPLPQDYVEVLEHFKIGNSKRALIFYYSITIAQSCIEQLFNDWLKKTVESEQNEDDNVLSSNIKTHSTRKGPPSYAVSFPGLVNVIQVWLRAGWSLGTCYF